ncbi:alpha/beta hydrolase [Amycolatopsis nigrescens]|uniref:alpha/beta hydrolase n=1 Tax=Amycolatopsis nigrescens TaxID=381445 RepID=UPI000477FDBE|nr:alpha/beta hydrolase [Amycolatopsis nigrescens]
MRTRALVGVLVAGTALLGLPVAAQAEQVAQADGPQAAQVGATPPVEWGPCAEGTVPPDQTGSFSCATYRVPIDHDDATLGTIDLGLLRRAATKPDQKVGSLFLNPGGPGGPGMTMPVSAASFFNPEVMDRFDLIGFDPRGVGTSNPLRCFTTAEDANDVFGAQVGVPVTRQEISGTLASYRDYGQFCERNGGALLHHMSTKDVVRDLDVLRAAVGDQKLNFVGFSYGTLIGSTYANMFPKNSRALVIDGNVDPALRTSDGLQYDRERARGFEVALDGFLAKCKEVAERCAFSPGQPREKFDELRTALREKPVTLPDGTEIDLSRFVGAVGGALYSPAAFISLAKDLQSLYDVLNPPDGQVQRFTAEDLPTLTKAVRGTKFDSLPDSPYNSDDSYLGVNCSDKKFGDDQEQVPSVAAAWEKESPTFGRSQAFSDPAGCPVWPVKDADAYRGPWNRSTENPVLVVGNFYDPATQYEFSKRMADQLGYSRLLSVDAFGHCILGDSAGVDKATADYLIDLKVPAPGQVFQPDVQPFTAPSGT